MREEKIQIVKNIKEKIEKSKVVTVLDMHKMPSRQLQEMREDLRDRAEIKMTKKTLIKRALDEADVKGIEKLEEKLSGSPALMFTDENPFKLYQYLKENKSPAKAKAGDVVPEDIVVEAGPTDLVPGPAISQLQSAGLQTSVEGGKIKIQKGATVLEKDGEVTEELANLFNMLGIEPMEVGLTMKCAFEDGTVYEQDILNIDTEEYRENINKAITQSINLSINAGYYTSENIGIALTEAFNKAKNLAVEAGIFTTETIGIILSEAVGKAKALESEMNK